MWTWTIPAPPARQWPVPTRAGAVIQLLECARDTVRLEDEALEPHVQLRFGPTPERAAHERTAQIQWNERDMRYLRATIETGVVDERLWSRPRGRAR